MRRSRATDWTAFAEHTPREPARVPIAPLLVQTNPAADPGALAPVSEGVVVNLLKLLDEVDDAVGVSLIEWLAYGDLEARESLRGRFAGLELHEVRSLGWDPVVRRRAWDLIAEKFEDTQATVEGLAQFLGRLRLIPTGAKALAEAHGLPEPSPGNEADPDGRTDLYVYEARPLLEVALGVDLELFYAIAPDVLKSPWLGRHQLGWLLGFLTIDDEQEVWTDEGFFHAVRADRLVVTWGGKHGKKGRVSVKVHESSKAAAKDFEKKVAKEAEKLGAAAAPPTVHVEDLDEALRTAANYNRRDDIETLLARGADPDAPDSKDGWTALHRSRGGDPSVVRALLTAGADADAATSAGLTPLDLIAGQLPSVATLASAERLVAAGAKGRSEGTTPLHRAAAEGNAALVRVLLDGGLSPTARDDAGKTPLELAEAAGHALTVAWLSAAG